MYVDLVKDLEVINQKSRLKGTGSIDRKEEGLKEGVILHVHIGLNHKFDEKGYIKLSDHI